MDNRWKTYVDYVDIETGEILTKYQVQKLKLVVNKTIRSKETDAKTRTIKYTYGVERNRQYELFEKRRANQNSTN